MDAWGRKIINGEIKIPIHEGAEEKFWAQWAACDPLPLPTPTPTPGPTPIPPSEDCKVVEELEHWMAPGDHCHAGDSLYCTVDSTIRPICDMDHMENWNTICGGKFHDPDYEDPRNAFIWTVEGAMDLGPNPSNAAQRIISGASGDKVKITVCIPKDAKTPEGCRITARNGNGCGTREFTLP
jgi:hypothetical protein